MVDQLPLHDRGEKVIVVEETVEDTAESISAALDFLCREAEAAGMSDLSAMLRQASAVAQQHVRPSAVRIPAQEELVLEGARAGMDELPGDIAAP